MIRFLITLLQIYKLRSKRIDKMFNQKPHRITVTHIHIDDSPLSLCLTAQYQTLTVNLGHKSTCIFVF